MKNIYNGIKGRWSSTGDGGWQWYPENDKTLLSNETRIAYNEAMTEYCNYVNKLFKPLEITENENKYDVVEIEADSYINNLLYDLENNKPRKCICGHFWKKRKGKYGIFWYCGNGHSISRSSVNKNKF